jgi:F0F1-type ATP synthase epsilon subunit
MHLRAATAEEVWLDVPQVTWVRLPLADGGSIGIRPGHAPLLAETVAGTLRYGTESSENGIGIDRGILQVHEHGVDIFASELGDAAASFDDSVSADGARFERLARALLQLLRADAEAYPEASSEASSEGREA